MTTRAFVSPMTGLSAGLLCQPCGLHTKLNQIKPKTFSIHPSPESWCIHVLSEFMNQIHNLNPPSRSQRGAWRQYCICVESVSGSLHGPSLSSSEKGWGGEGH